MSYSVTASARDGAVRRPLLGAVLTLSTTLAMVAPALETQAAGPSTGLGSRATITKSPMSSDAAALRDGRPTLRRDDVRASWRAPARPGEWVQFRWASVQRITSVQIYGATRGPQIKAGTLTFDNGTSLPVGEILRDPAFPTVIAFRTRSARWVRFTVTKVAGQGTVGISELRVYPKGSTALRYRRSDPRSVPDEGVNLACAPSSPREPRAGAPYVLCPLSFSKVRGTRPVTVHATGLTQVAFTAWSAEPGTPGLRELTVPVVANRATASIPFGQLRTGPVIVQVRGVAGPSLNVSAPTYFQVDNAASPSTVGYPSSAGARGKTLAYRDEFNRPVSLSLDGRNPRADYAAGKSEYWGVAQFGDAIFPDPARRFDNLNIVDGRYLRLTAQPNPQGYQDPNGWGRRHIGGIISSARPGGSGFSARYGYFEARIMAPAAPGTWPAFWLLPSDNLIEPKPRVAEIDVVELYGHDPRGACHTTHSYWDGRDAAGIALCGQRFGTASDAMRWHVYGVGVEPTEIVYWIDGKVVARAPQVKGGEKPMFFLLDLDLGGGYPLRLEPVQNRAAMYVDWVRVYV